jgi:hypothetical protein
MEQLIFIQFIQIYVYSVKSSTVIRTYILTCYINENRCIFNMEIRTYQSIYDFNKYSQICTKRSPLGQRNNGLIRQVISLKRFNSYEIFYDITRKW